MLGISAENKSREGREIVVDTDALYREDEDPQAWQSAAVIR
jgi:hypothetical protein